jgi:hypothetical protein
MDHIGIDAAIPQPTGQPKAIAPRLIGDGNSADLLPGLDGFVAPAIQEPQQQIWIVQCAWAARRKKGSYFNAQFLRLRGRRGPKKGACAVAASLLTTIYHMLKDGTQFQDLGADHFDRRSKDVRAKRLVTQLANLGFDAKITPFAQAA